MFCWKLILSLIAFEGASEVHRVKSVKPLENFELLIEFMNNERKKYDMKPLIKEKEQFKPLESVYKLWNQVRVDMCGLGICWNDDIDLSCVDLYEDGVFYYQKK